MSIKVSFPEGATTATVSGLHQWDYGQVLEIESDDIGSEILEAHFACHNMSEAIVRVCSFENGIGRVTIPDQCLEQTGLVNVWLYEVVDKQAHTIKTIMLPLTARTRPSRNRDIPSDYADAYGQLIDEVNSAVDAMEQGSLIVAQAINSKTAEHATTAGSASSASYATAAGRADTAGIADTAKNADNAQNAKNASYAISAASATVADEAGYLGLHFLVAKVDVTDGKSQSPIKLDDNTLYFVTLTTGLYNRCGLLCYYGGRDGFVALGDYLLSFVKKDGNTGFDITLSQNGQTEGHGILRIYEIGGKIAS